MAVLVVEDGVTLDLEHHALLGLDGETVGALERVRGTAMRGVR